jgi:nucleoside-triphosphatase THEP1
MSNKPICPHCSKPIQSNLLPQASKDKLAKFRYRAEQLVQEIAERRNKLRDLIDECGDLEEHCDNFENLMQEALDGLSEVI